MLCVLFAISFSACGDDNDEPEPPVASLNDPALFGTWTYHEYKEVAPGISYENDATVTFNANGSYRLDLSSTIYPIAATQTGYEIGRWTTDESHKEITFFVTESSFENTRGDRFTQSYYIVHGNVVIEGIPMTRL